MIRDVLQFWFCEPRKGNANSNEILTQQFFTSLLVLLLISACSDEKDQTTSWSSIAELTEVGWLMNVWGTSGDDLWTVGGGRNTGAVVRFDGAEWTEVDLGIDVPLMTWTHGFSSADVTMVGWGGTVVHFDGASYEQQQTPTTQHLWGVWGAAPDDLWAVGGNAIEEGDGVLLRYDGEVWREQPVPPLQRDGVFAFFKVWGTSANDVFIVGQQGTILHWDGTELIEQDSGTDEDLISLWGVAPDRVAAVGGRASGVIATWDGATWRAESVDLPGLNGVWMRTPNVVHAAGAAGLVVTFDFDTLDYEETYLETQLDLHSVFGDAGGRLTTVGGNLASPRGPYDGIAFRRKLREGE